MLAENVKERMEELEIHGDLAIAQAEGAASPNETTTAWEAETEGWLVRRAVTRQDLTDAYTYLSRTRVALGYALPPRSCVGLAAAGSTREMATFVAKAWPEVVGLATLVMDGGGAGGLPADRVFQEIQELRASGRCLAEVTNRAIVPAYHRTQMPGELLRCCVAHGLFVGCTDLLAVVHTWENDTFTSMGFERMGAVRSSGGTVPEPVVLARLNLTRLEEVDLPIRRGDSDRLSQAEFYLTRNPYRRHVEGWSALAEQAGHLAGGVGRTAPAIHPPREDSGPSWSPWPTQRRQAKALCLV